MAFPFTHLAVAYGIIKKHPVPEPDAALLLLGSIAPDAVHYREAYQGAEMKHIGAAKKITHLCPVSDEPWGSVTDNDTWIKLVKDFIASHPNDALATGYVVHVLTDIYNNMTLWDRFRTNYPAAAAEGYASEYYKDLRNIESMQCCKNPILPQVMTLLKKATPRDMPGLVTEKEIRAIQNNLLREHFKTLPAPTDKYTYLSYEDMLNFIHESTEFVGQKIPACTVRANGVQ